MDNLPVFQLQRGLYARIATLQVKSICVILSSRSEREDPGQKYYVSKSRSFHPPSLGSG